ncbi:MAG: STAS/SEC14 domain-containing protein [Alphaproteobacteria bacterium]
MNRTARKDASSIFILPESDERTLCVSFKGLISKVEYENKFEKSLDSVVARNPHFNLLIHYDHGYVGWDRDAADVSFQNILQHAPNARKLAYVNPPESKIFQVKMFSSVFGGEIRFFNDDELDEAIRWVKA